MANRTVAEAMWRWSDGGQLPIVCDASSCSLGLTSEIRGYLTPQNRERHAQAHRSSTRSPGRTTACCRSSPSCARSPRRCCTRAVRPITSSSQASCTRSPPPWPTTAVTPAAAGCCAFAGDRGYAPPELTRSATAEEAAEVRSRDVRRLSRQQSHLRDWPQSRDWSGLRVFCIFAGEIDAAGSGPRGVAHFGELRASLGLSQSAPPCGSRRT